MRFRGASESMALSADLLLFSLCLFILSNRNLFYNSMLNISWRFYVSSCIFFFFTWWLEKTKTKAAPAAVRAQVKRVPNRAWIVGLYPSNMVPDLTKQTHKFYPKKSKCLSRKVKENLMSSEKCKVLVLCAFKALH